MARLKNYATDEVSQWFASAREVLEDYEMAADDIKDDIKEISKAFENKTARWSDEEISSELDYLEERFSSELDPVIDIQKLIQAMKNTLKKAAEEWKESRDEVRQ